MNQGMGNGRKKIIWLAPVAVLVLVLLFIYAGRRPFPEAPELEVTPEAVYESAVAERMNDPEYVGALRELTEERRSLASAANAIQRKMDQRATALVQELKAEETAVDAAAPAVEDSEVEPPAAAGGMDAEETPASAPALGELLAERLKLRMESDPQMQQLEDEMEQAQRDLRLLQSRITVLIRNRMHEQVASRQHRVERPVRPGPAAGIRRQPDETPDFFAEEQMVITNMPPDMELKLPALPERLPPTPSGTGEADADAEDDSLETGKLGD